jgi:KaiC/GvpD/RAD55 family RecA-like ATPase
MENLDKILDECLIDFNKEITKPPIVLSIREFDGGAILEKRLCTLGNFSAITGKSKSKKTILSSIFLASAVKRDLIFGKIRGSKCNKKNQVAYFDTEQSDYDIQNVAHRMIKLIGYKPDNLNIFSLRKFTPLERCELIQEYFEGLGGVTSYCVIDGIADLSNAINDETEATRVTGLLLKWTKEYNLHISVMIHQNKNDNFATGHLGSSIMKKAETVISVKKSEEDYHKSVVSCDFVRGTSEFKDFDIEINDDGEIDISDLKNASANYEIKEINF